MYTLNCKGKLISPSRPMVMGIINATPDSFYHGDLPDGIPAIIKLAEDMIRNEADIIDIGAQSTRPGSQRISAEEEISRVIPVIKAIHERFPDTILSIDTYYSVVAKAAVEAGSTIVNDISGGEMDPAMISAVAKLHVPYICMHMKGTPENMHLDPVYEDVVKEVMQFFIAKIDECSRAGIHDLILDPGFGFGKTIAHNFTLLKNMGVFSILGKPILAGLSRKSTIYKTLGITAAEALNGTTILNTVALLNGADILRVHDVKEAVEAVKLIAMLDSGYRMPDTGLQLNC